MEKLEIKGKFEGSSGIIPKMDRCVDIGVRQWQPMKEKCARDVYTGCAVVTVHVRTRAIPRGVHAYTRANARPHGVPVHTSGETRERREAGALRAIGHLTNMAVPLFLTNTNTALTQPTEMSVLGLDPTR